MYKKCKARGCQQGNTMGELCIFHWEQSRGREVYPVSESHAMKLGLRASQASADSKWNDKEQMLVDAAIRYLATTQHRFTADDVWNRLAGEVPITKGLAARLSVAARKGLIVNTGEITHAKRGGSHDHAQRLSIWQSCLVLA